MPIDSKSRETLILRNSESMDEKLKRILNEKREQYEEMIRLKSELDEEKIRLRRLKEQRPNSMDLHNQNMNDVGDLEQQSDLDLFN